MLPEWNIKDSSHSARSAGGRIHLDRHDPLTKRNQNGLTMLSRIIEWTYQENKLACNWSWNACPQLSQLTEPLLTNHGLKSEISACKLISTLRKKVQAGNSMSNLHQKSCYTRKKPPQHMNIQTQTYTCIHHPSLTHAYMHADRLTHTHTWAVLVSKTSCKSP